MPNWPDTVNTFVSTVLWGFLGVIAAYVAAAALSPALLNGTAKMAAVTGTEYSMILGPGNAFLAALRIGLGLNVVGTALDGSGTFIGNVFKFMGTAIMLMAGVLLYAIVILLTLFEAWNFYTDVLAPTRIVDWTVGGVQTAVATLPMPPTDQVCKAADAVAGVVYGIIYRYGFAYFADTPFYYSGTDALLDGSFSCFVGRGPGSSASSFREFLENLSDRQFRKFVRSIEGAAAHQGKATRNASDTRAILDKALSRGWTLDLSDLNAQHWVGGRHVHIIDPSGNRFHFPIPDGFTF